MKYFTFLFFLVGCANQSPKRCATRWQLQTTLSMLNQVIVDTVCNSATVRLSDSVKIDKTSLDSLLVAKSDSAQFYGLINTTALFIQCKRKVVFNRDSFYIFRIWWTNDQLGFHDFSTSLIYSEKFGPLFKFYPRSRRDFYHLRLLSVDDIFGEEIDLSAFTQKLLTDTALFPQAKFQ